MSTLEAIAAIIIISIIIPFLHWETWGLVTEFLDWDSLSVFSYDIF